MIFTETPLKGSFVVDLEPFSDDRGWFARTFCKNEFAQIGHTKEWVQLNHSVTYHKGSIRGMHFQHPPYSEIKMVRCIAGAIFDVIIDLRQGSDSFLQWFGEELSAANKKMLYIPEGFAHGFQTLTDNCELIYHHTSYYTPGAEGGIRYDDQRTRVQWKLPVAEISTRDSNHPYLSESFTGIKL
ncbi:MAG TPA: dTDP-4-dehydrorhamnose 3,5-epimerase [Chitinophagaceae bacterium]|nr:dTDP-4-dehydrorhamnose 3,5-epimerase [Chitinophagaceae bacterium]